MNRRLHNNIIQLPLPRTRIHICIIPPLHPKYNLQKMRNNNITPLILIRKMQHLAILRKMKLFLYSPRTRTHEPRSDLGNIVWVQFRVVWGGGGDEFPEGGFLEVGGVVDCEGEEGGVFAWHLEGDEGDAGDGV